MQCTRFGKCILKLPPCQAKWPWILMLKPDSINMQQQNGIFGQYKHEHYYVLTMKIICHTYVPIQNTVFLFDETFVLSLNNSYALAPWNQVQVKWWWRNLPLLNMTLHGCYPFHAHRNDSFLLYHIILFCNIIGWSYSTLYSFGCLLS